MNGLINVYKEAGFTSFDVVAKLRGILGQKKIGHTGTLDPDAVGVLPICVGNATKVCELLTDTDKTYQAVMRLGIDTDTQDISGTILAKASVNVSEVEVRETISRFIGPYDQIPPMYSAKKINGKKLYELAREGKVVERKPCHVVIKNITIDDVNLPDITMTVECSKGTYIRTLCHDIGEQLQCHGTMVSLKRTRAGIFRIEDSKTLTQIEESVRDGRSLELLKPVDTVLDIYPEAVVKEKGDKLIYNGNAVTADFFEKDLAGADTVRVYDSKHQFVGIYAFSEEKQCYKPVKMFLNEI